MLVTASDYESQEGKPVTAVCCVCDKEIKDKWINYVPLGNFCPACAHHVMRILFEDVINYHNDSKVNLLNVMYHGDERKQSPKDNPGPHHKRQDLLEQANAEETAEWLFNA